MLQQIHDSTQRSFNDLKEGDIFTEKLGYFAIIAIVRKSLIVIYQGTETSLEPFCYDGLEQVKAKFANAGQSGYWLTFLRNDKDYLEKLINS